LIAKKKKQISDSISRAIVNWFGTFQISVDVGEFVAGDEPVEEVSAINPIHKAATAGRGISPSPTKPPYLASPIATAAKS
jgi:hypothetical protein